MPRNGGGRVLAQEIMVPNAAIRNLIRENKTHQIYASMQVGQDKSGMLTMNQALANLVSHQVIPFEEGVRRSTDRDEFMHLMEKFRTMGPAALGRAVQPGGAAAADDRMKTLGRQPAQKG